MAEETFGYDPFGEATISPNCPNCENKSGELNCSRINADKSCEFSRREGANCPPGFDCDMLDSTPDCADCWRTYALTRKDDPTILEGKNDS